ncbi:MAG TPA: GxxExxY protein [Leptospiraceae bacterium]|nr:GxxExxY protein [Leptospiraceae bacterium]HMY34158.1 GxxExxY protein [Leptospiraceae bacterium]HMZ64059.1 GxxExxY protein [Leptospiraceae bacterium]HNA08831.1 GxxExxY protein [Leptospiraceae bacterium]HNC57568.1 GxxExxY protein [Leptospiraceae bacterium]
MEFENISFQVIKCAIEVHKNLGPGLLESTYKQCLIYELLENNIIFESEKDLPILYKGNRIEAAYRIDLLIEGSLIVELKSISEIKPIHEAQIMTYMKLSQINKGLLINFNVKKLKFGLRRYVL